MKKGLALAFLGFMITTTIGFSVQRGCGTALSTIFQFSGWKVTQTLLGSQFADKNLLVVSVVSAVFSSLCGTLLMTVVGAARKRELFLSSASLATIFAAGGALYLALVFFAFPMQGCW